MKNIFVLACSVLVLASCADKNKEVETNDEIIIETPADSLPKTKSDTVTAVDTKSEEAVKIDAVAEKPADTKKTIEVTPAKEVKVEYASFGSKPVDVSPFLVGNDCFGYRCYDRIFVCFP